MKRAIVPVVDVDDTAHSVYVDVFVAVDVLQVLPPFVALMCKSITSLNGFLRVHLLPYSNSRCKYLLDMDFIHVQY